MARTFVGKFALWTLFVPQFKLISFLELRSWKTIPFMAQIAPVDKYPRLFQRQMEAFVYMRVVQYTQSDAVRRDKTTFLAIGTVHKE